MELKYKLCQIGCAEREGQSFYTETRDEGHTPHSPGEWEDKCQSPQVLSPPRQLPRLPGML